MRSKKNKISKNTTKKNTKHTLSFKILKMGYPLYASKKSYGDKILEHTKAEEQKYGDSCLFGNMSWFGDLEQAKSYKTKDQNIYKWKIKKTTNLLIMNKQNEKKFQYYFNNTKLSLSTLIHLTDKEIVEAIKMAKDENINCNYFNLSQNEKAFFEFRFAYGYMSVKDQYQFMKLIKLLITNKFIDITMRQGTSILKKLNQKINYYYLFNKMNTQKKYNRLSIYLFDKYALNNLCKIIPPHFKISGVFQENTKSFWFPDLVVYKMNIREYVLYNPHHNLIYDEIVE
jgi:hypothetical protein